MYFGDNGEKEAVCDLCYFNGCGLRCQLLMFIHLGAMPLDD